VTAPVSRFTLVPPQILRSIFAISAISSSLETTVRGMGPFFAAYVTAKDSPAQ